MPTHVKAIKDTKDQAEKSFITTGGGATNFSRALKGMADFFGENLDLALAMKKGEIPPEELFEDDGDFALVKTGHDLLDLLLRGIQPIDTKQGLHNIVKFNSVVEFNSKRHVSRQQKFEFNPSLVHKFKLASNEYAPGSLNSIKMNARNSKVVFIDPREADIGAVAAEEAALREDVITVTDYGDKEWPKDDVQASYLETILSNSNIIIIPSDAVVDGMQANAEAPEELFQRVRDQYQPDILIMSDGGEPVKMYVKKTGQIHETPIEAVEGRHFKLAIGDTRDAAFVFFLLKGNDELTALKKANAIAGIKIQHPSLKWLKHLDELRSNPLFKEDFEELDARKGTPRFIPDAPLTKLNGHNQMASTIPLSLNWQPE